MGGGGLEVISEGDYKGQGSLFTKIMRPLYLFSKIIKNSKCQLASRLYFVLLCVSQWYYDYLQVTISIPKHVTCPSLN